jgi:G patch domain-containing protein 1
MAKSFVRIGTPVEIPENELEVKKPVHIQDQIATDDRGRRRFHGAFTGGFSAGYFLSVGEQ